MEFKQILFMVLFVQVSSNEIKTVYTNGYAYSQYFPLADNMDTKNILRFSVRTSRDAHIVLATTTQPDTPVYEIVLGAHNNTMNYIRGRYPGQKEPSATIRTVNLLSQQEYRNFWIRLKADGQRTLVQVGMGGSKVPYQEWLDPNPLTPVYLSFRSGITAEWRYGYKNAAYTLGLSKDKKQTIVTATGYGQYFPLSEIASHSDNAITLHFILRTSDEFLIVLSPTVSSLGDVYEFGISETGVYLSRRHLGYTKAVHHRDGLLNGQERLGFWIKLTTEGEVMLGAGGSLIPLINWVDEHPLSPQFVSFSIYRPRITNSEQNTYADLQYGLGPDYSLASQDCKPRWKNSVAHRPPPGAIRAGHINDVELFVCRAKISNHYIPGSFVPGTDGEGQCEMSPNDFSVELKSDFQALTGCRFSWKASSFGSVPYGGIVAGETDKNTSVYVARVSHQRQIISGKLLPERYLTFVVFSDSITRPFTYYEVLVNGAPRH